MFEEVLKELKRLEGSHQIAVPVETDVEGYIEKECPSENCLSVFRIHAEDWQTKVLQESVYCPKCNASAPADNWWTTEQLEHAKDEAFKHLGSHITSALHRDARKYNASQDKNAFLKLSLSVSGSSSVRTIVPAPIRDTLEIKITCEYCDTRFAVVGGGHFCPVCGKNLINQTFATTLRGIVSCLDILNSQTNVIKEQHGKDAAELFRQRILEGSIEDNVSAFQALATALFESRYGEKVKKNVFQHIQDGSKKWENKSGRAYSHFLSESEIERLELYFQKRHVLAHRNGIVDDEYIRKSGDRKHIVGQRLVVSIDEVKDMTQLVEKLGQGLIHYVKS